MKLVAAVRAPANPEEAVAALAAAAGLTLAEARMRLAPEPPTLLARLAPEAAESLVAALRQRGLAVLAVEAEGPGDAARTLARTVALGAAEVTFQPRAGAPLALPWDEVAALL